MKGLRFIILLLTVIIGTHRMCADITVSGTIVDEEGEPVDALVTVLTGKRILSYSTATNGNYTLNVGVPAEVDSIILRASMIGFSTFEQKFSSRSSFTQNITLFGGNLSLKEVVVVPDKITQRGDTINFNVSQFIQQSDRVIGDVIKRMPGLEISEAGRIEFNGKAIKNFYVEDFDLLQGRYGLATNNISATDVAAVQVYQNHQPIKALSEWNPTEDVSINLRLKESVKGSVSLEAMAGGGYRPALWTAELMAMYFGKHFQNFSIYKGNNSGIDLSGESSSMMGNDFEITPNISIVSPSNPDIPTHRYLNNQSNTVSINNLFKADSLLDVGINVAYYDDLVRQTGETVTSRFIPLTASYQKITSTTRATHYIHNLAGSISIKKNSNSFYLDNKLSGSISWNKDTGSVATSEGENISAAPVFQTLKIPSFTLNNNLNIIRSTDSHAWDFSFNVGWKHQPQMLSVDSDISQTYNTDEVIGKFRSGVFHNIGKVRFNVSLFADIDFNKLNTFLRGVETTNLSNSGLIGDFMPGVEPRVEYTIRRVYFKVSLPLSYNLQWIHDDNQPTRNHNWHYINFNPGVHIAYSLGRHWLNANVAYSKKHDNSDRLITGVIMRDYLSLQWSDIDQTQTGQSIHGDVSYRYGNPFHQFFANVSLSWLFRTTNTSIGYDYDGIRTTLISIPQKNNSNNYTVTANINKGLPFWDSTFKLNGNVSLFDGHQVVNGESMSFSSLFWSSKAQITMTQSQWMGSSIVFAYSENFSKTMNTYGRKVRQWTGKAELNFIPLRNFVFSISAEGNYLNTTHRDKLLWFGDAKMSYSKSRFSYELSVNNIFNKRYYTHVSYDAMNIVSHTYRLRERNVLFTIRCKI